MKAAILAVNVGSTSVRHALYHATDGTLDANPVARGHRQQLEGQRDFAAALDDLRTDIQQQLRGWPLMAVAHRVVHGGSEVLAPVQATPLIMRHLEACEAMAPLHQPFNLMGIRLFQEVWPSVPQIVCPDTAFHAHLPEVEKAFALPRNLREQGFHRYGFHGLSCESVLEDLAALGADASGRIVLAHLGGGCSVTAIQDGRSVATSMGFSTLDGLVMSTRCGSMDAGVLLALMARGWTRQQIQELLYLDSGLKGLSGLSGDLRVLRAQATPPAAFAISVYVHRLIREIGALVTVMGGLECLVFTGGAGEGDARLRAEVASQLGWLGVDLDSARNDSVNLHDRSTTALAIESPDSRVRVFAMVADENRVAARHALTLCGR